MKNNQFCIFSIFLFAILILPSICFAWSGKVVSVADGDTITVLHGGRQEKIRLYGIDSPEKGQNFGQKAKDLTSSLVAGRNIEIEQKDIDRYGRIVGLVSVDGQNLNELIIRNGYAWVYRQYCKEKFCSTWLQLEDAARQQKNGMWADPKVIPPWEFRHSNKAEVAQSQGEVDTTQVQGNKDSMGQQFHGNINSRKFHRSSCQHFNCKNCKAIFKSREEAMAAGYSPCKLCSP